MTNFREFLDRILDPDVHIPGAPGLIHPASTPTTTGLKAIDAMVPIRRGGTIEMVGPAGTGQLVLALELLYRLGRTPNDIACVAVGAANAAIGSQSDLGHVVRDTGIPAPATAILTIDPAQTPRALNAAARLSAGLAHGGDDVILVVDESIIRASDQTALTNAAGLAAQGSVTLIAIRSPHHDDAPRPTLTLDTTLLFSIEQLVLGIFPAIDPIRSTSIFNTADSAEAVRRQLRASEAIRSWFAQPLFIAENYTGDPGTWIEPIDAESELARLVQ